MSLIDKGYSIINPIPSAPKELLVVAVKKYGAKESTVIHTAPGVLRSLFPIVESPTWTDFKKAPIASTVQEIVEAVTQGKNIIATPDLYEQFVKTDVLRTYGEISSSL